MRATASPQQPRLIVAPTEGHPGDVIYLSGGGFPPHTRLDIRGGCGGRGSGSVLVSHGAAVAIPGPTTDGHGQFVAYNGLTFKGTPPSRCTVQASLPAGKASGKTLASASYTVVAPGRPLGVCAAHMCLTVSAVLVRLTSGVQGNVAIKGWPGALAGVTVARPGSKSEHMQIRLDWEGAATLRLKVAPGLRKGVAERVAVSARLGRVTGSASAHFVVVPGGR
ncbi:MAG: hypothetical protein JOZ41_14055 [Chloroflexi bacterium]|nr:hypothetical protein [Chloroflexota bacterium]